MDQGFFGGGMTTFVVMAIGYAYFAVALHTMAKKTNTPNIWMAWVPLLNIYLLLLVADKPAWWLILFLIPLVNIVIMILTWMGVAERMKKPSWVGLLMIIPFVNIFVPGYLAFTD